MEHHEKLKKAAAFWGNETRKPRTRLSWGHIPQIKQHVCGLIGSPRSTSMTSALIARARKNFGVTVPLGRGISIGCGTAAKEIALAQAGFVDVWDLYEISEGRVEVGRKNAAARGLDKRINFHKENAFESSDEMYDLIFWSASLHHMFDIDAAVAWSLDHLSPGGLLLIDEYVGPNRFQWTDEMLVAATAARAILDDGHLRIPESPDKSWPRQVARPKTEDIIAAYPTESVQSEEIIGVIKSRMPDADIIYFGGVVYMVALSGILTNFTPKDEDLLTRLLRMDLEMTQRGLYVLAGALYRKPA